MNDLFLSDSFKRYKDLEHQVCIDDMQAGGEAWKETVNLDGFFKEIENVKHDMRAVVQLYKRLQEANEESKLIHDAKSMKELRARMDSHVEQVLKLVKIIKGKLETLELSNADQREKANEEMIENLISSGASETLLQKAIEEQGRGQVLDTVQEIQERHDAVKEMEKSLIELHQVFLDMAALVDAQGQQLNDIESHVARANSFVRRGNVQLEVAKDYQKNNRKWACIAIVIGTCVVIILLLPVYLHFNS
ncbi:hypothetical protein ACE6H2_011900 [Prunus campanulata]